MQFFTVFSFFKSLLAYFTQCFARQLSNALLNQILFQTKAANTRSNLFDQTNLTHFLNQTLQYQIRCLQDQISLKQTNQISFKEMVQFRLVGVIRPSSTSLLSKDFLNSLEKNVNRGGFRTQSNIYDGKNYQLLAVNCSHKNTPLQMFDWILNTPLVKVVRSQICISSKLNKLNPY